MLFGNQSGYVLLANLCMYGRTKLKRISKEQSVTLRPEFILFVMGSTGGLLHT